MFEDDEKQEAENEEATEAGDEGDDALEDGEEGEGGGSKKKLIIIGGAVVLVIVIVAVLFLTGIVGGGGDEAEDVADQTNDPALVPQTVYVDMNQFLVYLNNPGRQVSFLKVTITLELPNLKTKDEVESNMPRVRDSFQVYLRELRSSDLQGSAGIHRLREELVLRENKIIAPHSITDVLFKEIIVQ